MEGEFSKPWKIAASNKINMQLSDVALQVLTTDLFVFNLVKDGKTYMDSRASQGEGKEEAKEKERQGKHQMYYLGNLVNKIIEFFAKKADSSIDWRLSEREEHLSDALQKVNGLSDDMRRSVIDKLLKTEKERLIKKKDALLRVAEIQERQAKRLSITLNARNINLVNKGKDSVLKEYRYYRKRVDYVRALCEEYARLPTDDREKIFFADRLRKVEDAIRNRQRLLVTPEADSSTKAAPNPHLVIPYGVVDQHLVGYTQRKDRPEAKPYINCFRLGALKGIEIYEDDVREYQLSDQEKEKIEYAMEKKGTAFCREKEDGDKLRKVRIRLTEMGVKIYARSSYWRPRIDDEQKKADTDKGIYTFICTKNNARFYFTRFGENAEVLEVLEMSGERNEKYTEELRNFFIKQNLPSAAEEGQKTMER